MPIQQKPLFRLDALKPKLDAFKPAFAAKPLALSKWRDLIVSGKIDKFKETEILPDFISDVFQGVLGFHSPADNPDRHTILRENLIAVDGKRADAAFGVFNGDAKFLAVLEGKGPLDPLDRPFAGRKMSAVDQGFRYAINLKCDWVLVTNLKEIRLYHKGNDYAHYERFETALLADDDVLRKRFLFLLGAERVVRLDGSCHLPELLSETERIGQQVTVEFYQQYAGIRQHAFDQLCMANPNVPKTEILKATQKLLDRILFCTFAQSRGLLPAGIVTRTYKHEDAFNPRPIWENFRSLFRFIDKGNAKLEIDEYNGGLFAPDVLLDGSLQVPDKACQIFTKLNDYDYRDGGDGSKGRPVDVEILGHIFEQSISDLERLHDKLEGRTRDDDPTKGRRKKEGAFYTPAFITRYIVAQTLKPVVDEHFAALKAKYRSAAKPGAKKVFEGDFETVPTSEWTKAQKKELVRFWQEWQDVLSTIRILDPACGSGAFLIEAFNQLHREYDRANAQLRDLGEASLFDPDVSILKQNLYGVDLNEEAIEICRLSLWIKTAKHGQKLTSLDHTIVVGNSIVNDTNVHPRAFDWDKAFPEVMKDGGFDVVVANPPYIRQEWIADIKPHLQSRYRSYDGVADIYVYFYELGLNRLKPGGRLGFVVTNKWMKAGYAENLRGFFADAAWVESVVDFGHAKQIFPDADVFPCILVARKPNAESVPDESRVCAIPREQLRIDDLSQQIADEGFAIPRKRLSAAPWSLEPPAVDALMEKIRRVGIPLKEFAGVKPYRGVTTGLNEAFLIDTPTRDAIVKSDPKSAEIVKPYLRGQDVDRWLPQWAGLWMIFARRGIDIESYPAVKAHLELYRERLEPKPKDWNGDEWKGRKPGSYKWYELQDSIDFWQEFEKPKIYYQEIQFHPCYALDMKEMLGNNKTSFIPTGDSYLLAVLNSPLMWWHNWRYFVHMKDEALAPMGYMMEDVPIAQPLGPLREKIDSMTLRLLDLTQATRSTAHSVLDWLRIEYAIDKPTQKLANVLDLDAEALIAEVKKIRGKKNPLSVAGLKHLREEHAKTIAPAREQAAEAMQLERQLGDLVNEAYGLTPEEVALMWKTAPPRMPYLQNDFR